MLSALMRGVSFIMVFLLILVSPPEFSGRRDISVPTPSSHPIPVVMEPSDGQAANLTGDEPSAKDVLLPSKSVLAAEPPPLEIPLLIKRWDIAGKVAITFDDGPYPGMTANYLEILNQYGVQATFFMVGDRVNRFPDLARLVVEQGSEIGSHSWAHARMDVLDELTVLNDLKMASSEIFHVTGQQLNWFRPPYGRYTDDMINLLSQVDQRAVLWDVDPRDWTDPEPADIVKTIMDHVSHGSIIVLHEGRKNTLLALPALIEKLREQGLEPVTVSDLFIP